MTRSNSPTLHVYKEIALDETEAITIRMFALRQLAKLEGGVPVLRKVSKSRDTELRNAAKNLIHKHARRVGFGQALLRALGAFQS